MDEQIGDSDLFHDQPTEILAGVIRYSSCNSAIRQLNPLIKEIYDEFTHQKCRLIEINKVNRENIPQLPYKWLYHVKRLFPTENLINLVYSVDLTSLNLDSRDMYKLNPFLGNNLILSILDLGDNKLGDSGIGVLIDILLRAGSYSNKKLETLNLIHNSVGDRGANRIAEILSTDVFSITSLNLMGNDIGGDGGGKIGDALRTNRSLQWLNLAGNTVGDWGSDKIADALEENKTLTSLNLSDNRIGKIGGDKIADALEKNTTLTYLFIGFNSSSIRNSQKLRTFSHIVHF